jgi:Mg2+ and Co2+ transporter CorA
VTECLLVPEHYAQPLYFVFITIMVTAFTACIIFFTKVGTGVAELSGRVLA